MLGDIYCVPPSGGEARTLLSGAPFDADPRFSPEGDRLLYKSDAGQGLFNLYILPWSSCDEMSARPSRHGQYTLSSELTAALATKEYDDELLANGVVETTIRREQRLVREGRLQAAQVTNETHRWLGGGRFHPSGTRIVGSKMYDYTPEPWEWPVPSSEDVKHGLTPSSIGPGTRLLSRNLPPFWSPALEGGQTLGLEMPVWISDDELVYSFDQADYEGNGYHFNYNKDVHKGVYALYVANVTSGEKRLLVSNVPGGATRPEISHDRRTLAFVRRVRDKEALVVIDLKSGTIRNVWYGLSYDTQLLFSPQGTYPSFAFAPDDSSIVIWAAGKIWRVPLAVLPNGERAASVASQPHVIPFTAHVDKRVAELLTNDKDLLRSETAPIQRVHAFRGLRIDESGARALVADHASSYLIHLKGFDPRIVRIPTLHPDKPYYSPAFVPGTPYVIHIRWSDSEFSALELVDTDTLSVRELSGVPPGRMDGLAVSASPDSASGLHTVAWIRTAGDDITGNVAHTLGAGLCIATLDLHSAAVTSVRLVHRDIEAARLRFAGGEKYLVVEHARGAYALNLFEDGPPITLATGNFTTEVAVGLRAKDSFLDHLVGASDQPRVSASAFIDFAHLHVTQTRDIPLFSGTRGKLASKDLVQVSASGGHDLVFSEDGETVFWLIGPEMRQVSLLKLTQECNSLGRTQAAACAEMLTQSLTLNVFFESDIGRLKREAHAAGASEAEVWIVNATLITMKTGVEEHDVVPDAAILLRDGLIQRVMLMRAWENEFRGTESRVIDAGQGYVLPGYIDAHAHFWTSLYPSKSWDKAAFLAYGITTAHNPSTVRAANLERNRIESGYMVGPRIFHTDVPVLGFGGPGFMSQEVNSMHDAHAALERITAEQGPGASLAYKNYLLQSRAFQQRMLLAARNRSLLCVPEGGMFYDWDITYIIDGMNSIEHSLPFSVIYEDVKQLLLATGVANTPTHLVNYGGTMGEQQLWGPEIPNDEKFVAACFLATALDTKLTILNRLRRFLPHSILEGISETTLRPDDSWQLYNASAYLADLTHRGLPVLIGAHGEPPLGRAFHAELAFAQAGGLSNYEALRAATRTAAQVYGLFNSIGSIEPGKLADLVVYPPGADILDDIRVSKDLRYVVRGGRVWEAETLTEVWPVKGREATAEMPPLNAD
ncbi:hypothetical protein AURDEDRAFT_184428 [Auricularia subglabra TFB-10046 SS5]|nr:hypothetical protein AURDEDRAFT_184428 [Auricularia subglabra TFB-10046 SS5]